MAYLRKDDKVRNGGNETDKFTVQDNYPNAKVGDQIQVRDSHGSATTTFMLRANAQHLPNGCADTSAAWTVLFIGE